VLINNAIMNLATILTLSRLPFLLIIGALLIRVPAPGMATAAFVLFVIAAITDWLDGWVARRFNQITDFGKLMDALLDKILVVGLLAALLTVEILPAWTLILVILILSREFMITGLRLIAAARQRVLAAEKSGKIKTVLQMVSISSLLLALVLQHDVKLDQEEMIVAIFYNLGLITLILATVQTVFSGTLYFWKYRDLMEVNSPQS
jgi:CDP-diacylglycerol--glycerol-3-phosphate 3-phosphatidyltransferase